MNWREIDPGFNPCAREGCDRAAVLTLAALRKCHSKAESKCPTCGAVTMEPSCVKEGAISWANRRNNHHGNTSETPVIPQAQVQSRDPG